MEKIQSITSENIVVGALINNLNMILELPELKQEYFNSKLNKNLLKVLKNMFKDGSKSAEILDIYALCETDESNKRLLDDAGGLEHLETLRIISEDKDEDEIKVHANSIIDCAYKNTMVETLTGLSNFVLTRPEAKMESINKLIEKEMLEVKAQYTQLNKIEKLGSRLGSILSELDKGRQTSFYGFPTFSPMLDKFYTYEKGEMVVISAKAKMGKSQLITNEVYNLAILQDIPILILDTELSDTLFTVRLLARITGYNFNFIKRGLYKKYPNTLKRVEEAEKIIENAPIFHEYIVGWGNEQIFNEVKRLKIQENIQILFYDYLKIDDANENEHRELGNLTNFLKNEIAGKLKLSVVAFAQMSDYSDSNRLRIANSERIKNYASVVVFMVEKTSEQYARDFNEKGGNYYFFIAYNRNGSQMSQSDNEKGVNVNFNRGNATFTEAPYQCDEIKKLLEEQDKFDEELERECAKYMS